MKGGVHLSPFAALFFPAGKVLIYCWVDRVFQSSDGKARVVSRADSSYQFRNITTRYKRGGSIQKNYHTLQTYWIELHVMQQYGGCG